MGLVASTVRVQNSYNISLENVNERAQLEDQDADERI
jgi:hypothetical protein